MLFNFEKCKCLHAGHGNTGVNYEMGALNILCKGKGPPKTPRNASGVLRGEMYLADVHS